MRSHVLTVRALSFFVVLGTAWFAFAAEGVAPMQQVTFGPEHHIYGYIGHVGNTPWNGNGRYMVVLRSTFQDHLPGAAEAAEIALLDTENDYTLESIEETRAWNLQQGTMLYWNPAAPETQFFLNDRDEATGRIYCVLYDIAERRRVREYRIPDRSVGNSGVARNGYFLGLNYGRLARLRPVTGYPEAYDWTVGVKHPDDDGIFKIEVETGAHTLLVSYADLAKALGDVASDTPLFINHTLPSRDGAWVYFFARGGWSRPEPGAPRPRRINTPFSVRVDGTGLSLHERHIGGHPEWAPGNRLIGRDGDKQVYYDPETQSITGTIGNPEILPAPEGDIALSPDGAWLVNGYKDRRASKNHYVLVNVHTGAHHRLPSMDIGEWISGDLRIDGAPCWRRDGRAIAVPGLAADGTRQTFVIDVSELVE